MFDPTRDNIDVTPGSQPDTVVAPDGQELRIPEGWALLPSGDAGLTRRCKSMGPTWTVIDGRERPGLWAPADQIARAREAIEALRSDPKYLKRLEAEKERRALREVHFRHDFQTAVTDFLYFDAAYEAVAGQLAGLITEHALSDEENPPSRRRKLENLARDAVIAWVRTETAAWDDLAEAEDTAETRRELKRRCKALVAPYRAGALPPSGCPIMTALGLQGDVRSTAAAEAEEAERLRVERENERRIAAGLPPTPWPRPAIERPLGGWSTD